MSLLSVQEAAGELGLDPSRVRALVSSGELHGVKVGERWAVEGTEVARRKRYPRPAGRPFAPSNAWGILFLASDLEAPWLEASVRWRLRQGLVFRGLAGLRPRLGRRAEPRRFHAHPSELGRLRARPELVKSGISASGHFNLGLAGGEELDGYVSGRALKRMQREHSLEPTGSGEGNVILRAVPDRAWHLPRERQFAPIAAVAVDLSEDPDSRSSRIGKELIKRLDRGLKASR